MKSSITLLFFIASFYSNAQTWQDVGGGTNNSSHGMLVWNNELVNLGSYNNPCQRVSTWDGTSWNCLGGGVGIVARAGTVWNGNLVVIGDFWNNFQPCVGCNGIAMWDGTTWTAFDDGFNNDVLTVTTWNGELIVGGDFTQANGVPVSRVVRWDVGSSTFISMGATTDFGNDVRCMTEYNGDLWVGGDFNNVGGCSPCDGLVKWDVGTSTWTGGNSGVDLVGGVNESVRVLYVNPNDNNLYMGGEFPELQDGDAASQDFDMSGIAMYDGSNWFPLGTGLNEYCRAIHEYNGNLIAGGYFTTAGGVPANKIAKWTPGTSTWSAMGQGFDGAGIDEYVKSATVWNGIFFAGGAYTQAEGGPMNYIAQWFEPNVNPPVAAFTPSSINICEGDCISFTDNSTNTPTGWTWAFPGSSTASSTSQNPSNICFPTAGTYTVQLTACNGNGCDVTTIDINVGSSSTLTVNSETICNGQSATLTAVPSVSGGTFIWSPGGATTNSISVSPTSTTTYSVDYILNGCSSNTAVSTVTVNPTPTVTVNSETICSGQSTTLTAAPSAAGGTYSWSPGGQTTNSISINPNSTSTYSVIYTLNGCSSVAAVSTVTVNPTPILTVNNETICDGQSATLTATPSASGGTYLWSPGGQTTNSISVSPSTNSNYSVTYTLNGCTSSAAVSIVTVNPSPTVSVSDVTICDGNSTTLTATPSTAGGTYNWTVGGETTPSISTAPSTTTTYSVIYTLNNCPSTEQFATVTVNPSYSASENVEVCEGDTWNYHDGSSEVITTNTSHTNNLSTGFGCDSIIITNITVKPSYNTIDNIDLCEGSDYIYPDGTSASNLTVDESHISTFTTTLGCDSIITTNITVNAMPDNTTSTTNNVLSSNQSSANYQWLDCDDLYNPITGETAQTYSPSTNGNYAVEIDLNGCVDTSDCETIATIGINANQQLYISVSPNPVSNQLTIMLQDINESIIELFDMNGKLILQTVIQKGENQIDMSQMPNGMFLLKATHKDGVYTEKIIKE